MDRKWMIQEAKARRKRYFAMFVSFYVNAYVKIEDSDDGNYKTEVF